MATVPAKDEQPPMAERDTRRSGASTGGIAESPVRGVEDALRRSTERRLDDPAGASVGNASASASGGASSPRIDLGGTNEPGAGPGTRPPSGEAAPRRSGGAPPSATASPHDAPPDASPPRDASPPPHVDPAPRVDPRERDAPAHHPQEPRREGAVESLGRAIGEVVTGSDEEDIDPRRPAR